MSLLNHPSKSKCTLLPHSCLMCHDPADTRVCRRCQQYLVKPQYTCQTCALPLPEHSLMCGQCLQILPSYDQAYAPYLYQVPLVQLLRQFKEGRDLRIGKALSELFAQAVKQHYQQQHWPKPDYVAPVPLHWWRHWQRGFNQAALLSEALAQTLEIKHLTATRRTHAVLPQKSLSRRQRLGNRHHGFVVNCQLQGEDIAVVDDVMTTGATVNAFAKALKQAGAGKVVVWALARTPL